MTNPVRLNVRLREQVISIAEPDHHISHLRGKSYSLSMLKLHLYEVAARHFNAYSAGPILPIVNLLTSAAPVWGRGFGSFAARASAMR